MLPFFHELEGFIKNLKSKSGYRFDARLVFILGVVLLFVFFLFTPNGLGIALSIAFFLSPLWLPALIVGGAWTLWVILKRSEFIAKQTYIVLEIKPPRTIVKTPLAMEAVLSGLHLNPGEGTWYKKYILGGVRPWWSLEIASIEGQVHFFIWTRAGFRRIIESQIYAQYPGAQVVEAPDYARLISAHHEAWQIWGCDFAHTNKDPLPIKTYVDYGLDKVAKEPEQVDPLANLVEFMGAMGKGEHLWLQMIIRVHKGEKYGNKVNKDGKQYTWKDEAIDLVKKMREEARTKFTDAQGNEQPGFPNPSKGQSDQMAAIERNVAKLGFDVGIRGVYLASPDKFDSMNISGLTGIFKQFSSETWNGFKPTHWMTEFDDYPWETGVEHRKNETRHALVDAYRRRQYFHEPYPMPDSMVMSTEELATIFHIPSKAVEAPSLGRIQSSTGEAPPNLPT